MFKGIGLFLIALLAMAMTGTLAGTAHAQTSYCSFLIDGTEYLEFPNIIKQGARVRANCPLGLIDGELKISSELEGTVIIITAGTGEERRFVASDIELDMERTEAFLSIEGVVPANRMSRPVSADLVYHAEATPSRSLRVLHMSLNQTPLDPIVETIAVHGLHTEVLGVIEKAETEIEGLSESHRTGVSVLLGQARVYLEQGFPWLAKPLAESALVDIRSLKRLERGAELWKLIAIVASVVAVLALGILAWPLVVTTLMTRKQKVSYRYHSTKSKGF